MKVSLKSILEKKEGIFTYNKSIFMHLYFWILVDLSFHFLGRSHKFFSSLYQEYQGTPEVDEEEGKEEGKEVGPNQILGNG